MFQINEKREWLLFFYSVPAKPVNNRMKVWRRLAKAGALQVKDAVYLLPYSSEHYEFFQWLTCEVTAMQGYALFVKVDKIETLPDTEIKELFNLQRRKDYGSIEKTLKEVEAQLQGSKTGNNTKKLSDKLYRCINAFEEVTRIDFFSLEGEHISDKIKALEQSIQQLQEANTTAGGMVDKVPLRRVEDFQGKTWVTRAFPFVDRMACAWLIHKYIDSTATFEFRKEEDMEDIEVTRAHTVAFDVKGGEFAHCGNLCTFEVFIKSFGLKDKALSKIAKIVHEIDIRDDKYRNTESTGVEEILSGIRKTAKDDQDAIDKAFMVFEMLYATKS